MRWIWPLPEPERPFAITLWEPLHRFTTDRRFGRYTVFWLRCIMESIDSDVCCSNESHEQDCRRQLLSAQLACGE